MPQKTGWVIDTFDDGWAEVVTDRLEACAECASSRSCHSDCRSLRLTNRVINAAGAKPGDTVSIYLSFRSVLKSASLLYLLPVACLLAGAFYGAHSHAALSLSESAAAILFALVGLCTGFAALAIFSGPIARKAKLTPVITRVIHSGVTDDPPAAFGDETVRSEQF
jgi:sigma-E factor negative regulatory protein RseC